MTGPVPLEAPTGIPLAEPASAFSAGAGAAACLNGEPPSVVMTVTVHFTLGR